MKKAWLALLALGIAFGAMPHEPALAAASWSGSELKPGQIGRVTALTDTSIYTKEGSAYKKISTLKQNHVSRVYTNRGGWFGIGGGKYVQSDRTVKYETPSRSRYEAVNGIKSIRMREGSAPVEYPQMIGMTNREAEKAINQELKNQAGKSAVQYKAFKEKEEKDKEQWEKDGKPYKWVPYEYKSTYEIHFNKNHLLSIVFYEYQYLGGAHGTTFAKTLNFNTLNGTPFQLTKVIHDKIAKLKNYAAADLRNQANKQQTAIFEDALKDITINNSRTWTFHSKGIKLIFQQYEVGPYASGMPEVTVPISVYQ
ncbi:DUF3298/DUF4163 domain-containing protein [Bacillus sp. FJAT-42376]|uniref:DUF3298 and DUF4163 domain-containing protein n=1 Tax=Bacillus sp. FJAT-42376 TaxID=2014076 RepID=UPI000F4EF9B5|nr:DUF3298 and DUF4163 domain-containing protein [Bacillus sp. FJAT-42376]AZB44133.1 DUF3298/DUF4163 domain-containing protein [Bacillus sp. FJAT-42376]